jgi:hypothetical protein
MTTQRHGTFSSSNNYKLMTNGISTGSLGAPAKTYIKQVKHEQQLGRAVNPDRDSRPTTWGTFAEKFVFMEKLPIDYKLINDKRFFHPRFPWSGSPDVLKGVQIVGDVKCPFNLDVFCTKLEILSTGDSELYKAEFPEDYWQHISNACLLHENGFKIKTMEAIIYCPYQKDLQAIRDMVQAYDGPDLYRFKWIAYAMDEEMPYLIEGGRFKDLNIFQFEIPDADKIAMYDRQVIAASELNEVPSLIPA